MRMDPVSAAAISRPGNRRGNAILPLPCAGPAGKRSRKYFFDNFFVFNAAQVDPVFWSVRDQFQSNVPSWICLGRSQVRTGRKPVLAAAVVTAWIGAGGEGEALAAVAGGLAL
jgi:hypothetical protein